MAGQLLQKAPAGLLQLFRLRSGGVGPNVFSDELVPTCDATNFYGADRTSVGVEVAVAGAFPRTAGGTASANPRRILAVGGRVVFGAAVAGTFVNMRLLMYGLPGSSFSSPQHIANYHFVPVAAMAAMTFAVVAVLPGPLVLPAGHQFALVVQSDVAGVDHAAQLTYTFQRLDND